MGSSSSGGGGGSSSSRTKKAVTAATIGSSILGPVGGAIAGGLAGLSGTSANKSSGASPGMIVPGTPQSTANNTYNNQGYVDLLSNPSAQSEWPFKDVQAPNNQYVPLSSAVDAFKSMQETPVAPEVPEYDPTEYINQMKEAQRASRIASLDKAKSAALSSLDTEKANVAPTYYDKRNQAAAASDVGAMNFAQYMAARGIKGAAGAMPEVYRQAGLQGQIGALDRQEAANLAAIERQRAGVESGYASDVAAAEADVEAQAMQNYINQMNADRAYQLQQAAADLDRQRFDWSKSSSNPDYQASIAAARAAELANVAREIENSYLPETLKNQARLLVQQVEAGQYSADQALAQLNQTKAQTSVYQRQANAPYSSGSSDSDTKRDNAANSQQEVYNKLASGVPIEQVEAWIVQNASKYTSMGVNPWDLIDYAYYVKTGAKKPKAE